MNRQYWLFDAASVFALTTILWDFEYINEYYTEDRQE